MYMDEENKLNYTCALLGCWNLAYEGLVLEHRRFLTINTWQYLLGVWGTVLEKVKRVVIQKNNPWAVESVSIGWLVNSISIDSKVIGEDPDSANKAALFIDHRRNH